MRNQWEIEHEFSAREALDDIRSFYLVGIGGASMSALAKMLKERGYAVAGSDSTASTVTAELMSEGIPIRIGHEGEGIMKGDAVILTDAIDLKTSPEVARAKALGCSLFRRSQLLGWLLKGRRIIAVTGTHGKTTTTGLVSFALIGAGFDPLCVEGANIPQWGGPVRYGEGEWAVIEACEAYDSLRDFDPEIVVLTNLELDHEDFYTGGWDQLKNTILKFVNRAKTLVYCAEDKGAVELAAAATCTTIPYGMGLNPSGPHRPSLKGEGAGGEGSPHQALHPLNILGRTNALNAAGALQGALAAGADEAAARKGMAEFKGAERRLQPILSGPIEVIDDYAHHPSEIVASIGAIRDGFKGRRVVVVFQPHLYSRTAAHLDGFVEALSLADHLVITDIYPAREAPLPGISSARIADKVTTPCTYVPSRHLLPRLVADLAKEGDVVVGMGAGNISDFAPTFVDELKRRESGRRLRIAVVYGGDSAEREVSLLSGRCVLDALIAKGHDAFLVDVSELLLSTGDLSQFIGSRRPDLAFLAVHGTNAEDGAIQGLFELLHIPYTCAGVQSSAIAMDKQRTKQILNALGLPVAQGYLVRSPDREGESWQEIGFPVIVKPNAQGSTVGVSFVYREEALKPAIIKALQYDDAALIEELVVGTEISVPVIGDRALPVVEIVPNGGAYDFESKYTPGATVEICPARLDPEVTQIAQNYALAAHRALGCVGASRTDMIVRDNSCVILEVNTLPGMTGTSLLPNSARAAGISFEDLCDWMVRDALAVPVEGNGAKA